MYQKKVKKFCWHCKADHIHQVDITYPEEGATVNYECLECGTHSSQALALAEGK